MAFGAKKAYGRLLFHTKARVPAREPDPDASPDLDAAGGLPWKSCKWGLPRSDQPGTFVVFCDKCTRAVAIQVQGRVDDPSSARFPCRRFT